MGHPYFEQLLFERDTLPAGERARLDAHLAGCAHCSQLHNQWDAVEGLLRSASSVPAPKGFTARFQARLEKVRQRRHARLVLMTTTLTILVVLGLMGLLGWTLISSGATLISWSLKAINQLSWLGTVVEVVGDTVILFLESLFEQLPVVILLAISAAVSVLSFTWITSFYRLSYREIRRE